MKFKTTNQELKNGTFNLFCVGYQDLKILKHIDPIAYNSGIYGWNYDVYKIGNCFITTGYRNLAGKRISSEIIKKYNIAINEIDNKYKYSSVEKDNCINILLFQLETELRDFLINE